MNTVLGVICGLTVGIALGYQLCLWETKRIARKSQKATEPPVPEIGDEYLILDHVWRVRSREAAAVGAEQLIKYIIYIEFVPSDIAYEGTKLKRCTPEWLANFQSLGRTAEPQSTGQMANDIAIKHGVAAEEVATALQSEENKKGQ